MPCIKMRVLTALVLLSLSINLAGCATTKANPNEAVLYRTLWQEAEKDLQECVEKADRLAHP